MTSSIDNITIINLYDETRNFCKDTFEALKIKFTSVTELLAHILHWPSSLEIYLKQVFINILIIINYCYYILIHNEGSFFYINYFFIICIISPNQIDIGEGHWCRLKTQLIQEMKPFLLLKRMVAPLSTRKLSFNFKQDKYWNISI